MPPCCLHINSKSLHLTEKLPQLKPKIPLQYFLSTMDWGYIGQSASLTASGETQQCGVVQGSSQAPEAGSSEHHLPQQGSCLEEVAQLPLHISSLRTKWLLGLPFLCANLSSTPQACFTHNGRGGALYHWGNTSLQMRSPSSILVRGEAVFLLLAKATSPMGAQALTPVFILGI